eukprot:m.374045 g.374045  ORF g.374045 m.374045 type:complete len:58 (-) comp20895_c0_seq12:1438-1611(-)
MSQSKDEARWCLCFKNLVSPPVSFRMRSGQKITAACNVNDDVVGAKCTIAAFVKRLY